ncbi:hypothetical protein B0H16DRAFT_1501619 [Mycena metata]|uniref:Uncharacterized protein n=1 Tax=Mycena metata TaxID=1033252 RepID=A0AAD7NXE3_9AGAR|nr:hypothetical protein B0H16DRAFT_1501619 [Mycena metata]
MSSNSPVLPLELEREIFEEAAIRCPETIPSLLLVSHRVYEILKIKYRTVTPKGELSTCTFAALRRAIQYNSKAPSFRTHVRHLYIAHSADDGSEVQEILFACAGIQSLSLMTWANIPPSILLALSTLRPRRLWVHIDSLLAAKDLCQPMFTFVTHLLLIVQRTDIGASLSFLANFPSLTHLTIVYAEHTLASHILASFKRLKVVVEYSVATAREELDNVDDRYVTIALQKLIEEWVVGSRGGNDFWARAEAFIAKKRRREIQPDWRYWIEDADGV